MSEFGLVEAFGAFAEAMRRRRSQPPPPLLVPSWLLPIAEYEMGSREAAEEWLDREARSYGFDGYTEVMPPPRTGD